MLAKYAGLKESVSPSELSRAYIEETGILTLLKEEGTAESLERWQNVQELLSAIMEMSTLREDATLESFLQDVSLVAAVDTLDADRNVVTLMTLHSAKGLEFPLVFIAGLEEGLLPLYATSPERKEVEEERRLFYVGITRAMRKLYFTSVRLRFRYGETSMQSPSRFLEDLPPEVIEAPVQASRRSAAGASWERGTVAATVEKSRRTSRRDTGFEADQMPDYENESDVHEPLRSGKMVMHVDFGKGKVITVSGTGDAMKAVVDFEMVGKKNLMVKYAKLKLL
jgi:DNA helicase-2/ATP-dependent DNA helicase PcrA